MASEVVAGCVIPLRVADHPALELCNTGAGWTQSDHGRLSPAKDYLVDARTLLVWAGTVGVLSPVEVTEGERAAAADPAAAARPVAGLRAAVAAAVRVSSLRPIGYSRSTWDGGPDPLRRPVHRLALLGMSLL